MHSANETSKASIRNEVTLHFNFLPAFAQFLLNQKLDDFVREIFRLTMELDIPIMKFLALMPEEQLLLLATESNKEFLTHLAQNKATEFVEHSIKMFSADQMPLIARNQVAIDDITLISFARKKCFLKFLPDFTSDLKHNNAVIEEIDSFTLEVESRTFKKLAEYQQELYKQAQALSRMGSWTWDVAKNKLEWSDELYRIYELQPQSEISYETIFNFNHDADKALISERMQKSIQTSEPNDFYYRITVNGKEKTLHALGTVLMDENGTPAKMFGTLQDVTEQKRIERELSEHQNFIQKIANVAPSMIAAYNIHTGKYIFINSAVEAILGYSPGDFMNGGAGFAASLIHPEDLQFLMEKNTLALQRANEVAQADDNDMVEHFTYRMRHKNGEYRWIRTHGTVFDRDSNKQVQHVLNISVDVTDENILREGLEQTNRDLEERTRFAETLLDSNIDMITALDSNLRYTAWNKKCEEILGFKRQEVIGKHMLELFPSVQGNKILKHMEQALQGIPVHIENREAIAIPGMQVESFILPLYNADNKVNGIITIARDITGVLKLARELEQNNIELKISERKLTVLNRSVEESKDQVVEYSKLLQQKNDELRKSEELYQRMVREVQDYSIILLDKKGFIQNWNVGAEKIKGYKKEEIVGKHFRIFYMKKDQEKKLPEKLISEAEKYGKATHEGYRVRKDGSMFWGSIVITALHDEKNHVIGFSKVTRDLTDRKLAEDQLKNYAEDLKQTNTRLESANKELSSFSYVASHDLQEPLRKIQTFSSRILDKEYENLSSSGKEFFDRMRLAANRMQKLLEDLLAFSRTDTSGDFEPVDLNAIVNETKIALKESIEEKNAVIKSENLPIVMGIHFQFQQLFENLIGNAIKYSKPDSIPQIRITSKIIVPGKIKDAAAVPDKRYFRISIADNGIGFNQNYEHKIFEIFQRLHGKHQFPGTGIGLAICKKIVENHQGFIRAKGETAKGATFEIYLPVKE